MDEAQANGRGDLFQVNPRDRLFYTIFVKVGQMYSRSVPPWFRTLIEVLLLIKAASLFTMLSYIHYSFSKYPIDCLGDVKHQWPRDGILRLQIVSHNRYRDYIDTMRPVYVDNMSYWPGLKSPQLYRMQDKCGHSYSTNNEGDNYAQAINRSVSKTGRNSSSWNNRTAIMLELASMESTLEGLQSRKELSVMEYSLEYGFLTLSKEVREKLNISVKVVNLDPAVDKCFGDGLSQLILDRFLGYDDILMSSIKRIAELENNQGYMKNCRTGEQYHFVTMWMGRSSYLVALVLMFVFTLSISTLLRFCHQQIFIFIVHVLQIMEWNAAAAFPTASLFTVILSLVGMEAIMSEFFNDATTSFYVILIVWSADQYDSICCHTTISQRHWLKFFYLYHFFFYAYHYRFNGQYSSVALATSWFFIQHSMLYFFHNYELPVIENQTNQNQQQANEVYFDDAILMLFDDLGQLPYGPGHVANNNDGLDNNNRAEVNEDEAVVVDEVDGDAQGRQEEDASSVEAVSDQLVPPQPSILLDSGSSYEPFAPQCEASSSKSAGVTREPLSHPPNQEVCVLPAQCADTEDVEFIDLTNATRLSFDDD